MRVAVIQHWGWTMEPLDLIGSGDSLLIFVRSLRMTLLAIRPCRESKSGWTPQSQRTMGNHISLELNELGPALKVFWLRNLRSGRRLGQRGACQMGRLRLMGSLPKKNRAGGSTDGASDIARSGPLLSVGIRRQGMDQANTR